MDIHSYLTITFHIHVRTIYTIHTHTQRERVCVCYLLAPARGSYCRSLASFRLLSIGHQEHTEDASHNHWHYDLLLCYVVLHTYTASLQGEGGAIYYNIYQCSYG